MVTLIRTTCQLIRYNSLQFPSPLSLPTSTLPAAAYPSMKKALNSQICMAMLCAPMYASP